MSDGAIEVHGVTASRELTQQVLDAATEDVERYRYRLPAGDAPIRIEVAATEAEFNAVAGDLGRRNVLGAARSAEGIIVLKSPDLLGTRASLRSVLRHEILHVLIARNTDLAHVPRWLNEGIAMEVSGELRWAGLWELARMYLDGRLLDYTQLELAFASPGNEVDFGDAYIQSHSMVKKLMRDLGEDRFWAMIYDLKNEPFDRVLPKYRGYLPAQFYEAWRASFRWTAILTGLVSSVTLFQVTAGLLILAYWIKRRRGKRIVKRWEAEDDEDDSVILPWHYDDD